MAVDYVRAERYRQERMNAEAWLNGAYVARALASTVGNMFVKNKADAVEYPLEPIPLFTDEQREDEKKKTDLEEQEALFAQAYLSQMVLAGKNWGKNKQRGDNNVGS